LFYPINEKYITSHPGRKSNWNQLDFQWVPIGLNWFQLVSIGLNRFQLVQMQFH